MNHMICALCALDVMELIIFWFWVTLRLNTAFSFCPATKLMSILFVKFVFGRLNSVGRPKFYISSQDKLIEKKGRECWKKHTLDIDG